MNDGTPEPGPPQTHWRTEKRKKKNPVKDAAAAATAAAPPVVVSPYAALFRSVETEYNALLAAGADARLTKLRMEREALGDGAHMVSMRPGIVARAQLYYPLVSKCRQLHSDLESLFHSDSNEFCFSLLFSPLLIDACCQNGVFPMMVHLGTPVFAPKLHVERAVAALSPDMTLPGGVRSNARGFALIVDDGWARAVDMVRAEHGENWLCAPLRRAFRHMALHPGATRTAVHCVAVVDLRRLHESLAASRGDAKRSRSNAGEQRIDDEARPEARPEARRSQAVEAAMVSCELGFTVGDVYTSLTGAYDRAVSGAGAVQMSALAVLLHELGYRQWDLGMMMGYKGKGFGARNVPRWEWVRSVRQRRGAAPDPPTPLPGSDFRIVASGNGQGLGSVECAILPCVPLLDLLLKRRKQIAA